MDRYAYVNNAPVNLTDPSGHMVSDGLIGEGGGCDRQCWDERNSSPAPKPPKGGGGGSSDGECHGALCSLDKKDRQPGDPLCELEVCEELIQLSTTLAYALDWIGLSVSVFEATIATGVYATALAVCAFGGEMACGAILLEAVKLDAGIASVFGIVEDTAGIVSTGLTIFSDALSGNFGYDESIGVYVGRDSIVSVRNSGLGLIPESIVDAIASYSQLSYDIERIYGGRSGGYVKLLSSDFLEQAVDFSWIK